MSKPNRLLILMVATWATMGLIDAHLTLAPQSISPFALPYGFAIAALIYRWCHAHAAARGIEPPYGLSVIAAFWAPIGIPLYFLRTLPLLAAGIAILKSVVFSVVLLCIYVLSLHFATLARV